MKIKRMVNLVLILALALTATMLPAVMVFGESPAFGTKEPTVIEGARTDAEAPTAPTGLRAGEITDTAVVLNWNASKDNEGVMQYEIRYGTKTLLTENTNATIPDLLPNTSYTFQVKARDAAGNLSAAASLHLETKRSQNDHSMSDWRELQSLASSRLTGVYAKLPGNFKGYADGPLLGNGDVGTVSGGTADSQTIYIDKNDFWMKSSKLTVGGVTVTNHSHGTSSAPSYRYEQDLLSAEVRADVTLKNVQLQMKTWVDANSNLVITELRTQAEAPVPLTVDVWVPEAADKPFKSGTDAVRGLLWAARESSTNQTPKEWMSRAVLATRLLGAPLTDFRSSGGRAQADFMLQPNTTVTLVTQVSGGGGENPDVPEAGSYLKLAQARVMGATPATIAAQHEAHLAWWKNFWLKSYVITNDEWFDKYYFGALYALAASNRTGKAAPGIFGSWITNDSPGWGSRYFLNYNFENPYWGVFSSNRPELADAYFDLVLGYMPYGINRTHEAGYRGFSTTRSLARPYGQATVGWDPARVPVSPVAPVKVRSKLNDQLMLGAYLATNFINHYTYTKDTEFLRNKAYPFLLSLADFWEDYLVMENGKYVIKDSAPREANEHDDNSILDIAMVKFLMKGLLTASRDLDVDASRRAKWQDIMDKLADYPTFVYPVTGKEVFKESESYIDGKTGKRIVNPGRPFIGGTNVKGPWHAVMTGLFWPSDEINLSTTSRLKQIALNTIEAYGSWEQTNSFAMQFPAAVRIGYDIDEVLTHFKKIISSSKSSSLLMRNNLTVYQKGGGIETSGSVETINALMLQSYFDESRGKDVIHLFPMLPKDKYPEAHFRQLRARGAFVVSSGLHGGAIADVRLTSEKGGPVHIVNPFGAAHAQVVKIDGTSEVPVRVDQAQGLITFQTEAGATYKLRAN
ncbi:glycosyl hydrolase family 95 catalytic domain-containing protein [Paenibacillus ehimensis]|uniref:Fibronectin type III domain-containing protein n=1 Tax=Paenibacillus ehimensis TaxID=79264 RepID=A0ABT8VB56_9BACL|nr:fibronectin type III domain-containing protein [Paenibacillus ehimensis]MDO3678218.1 fibronectin type III domain-containing protein [Paenibacillus ehimensis]